MAEVNPARAGAPFTVVEYARLQRSLLWKRVICIVFLLSVVLYLPVGMCLVTDWYDYSNDALIHSFRAVCQHVAVLCLLLFFGTFCVDFGDLNFFKEGELSVCFDLPQSSSHPDTRVAARLLIPLYSPVFPRLEARENRPFVKTAPSCTK